MTQKPSEFLRASTHGYTIFELALVFVILALLVGATLVGKDMIRASELRAVTVERNNFETAINSFEAKFHQFPGDMPNAFKIWGTTCGTDSAMDGTGCNGDGNGYIEVCYSEHLKMWEHLQLAEIIEGTYDGTGVAPAPNDPQACNIAKGILAASAANSPNSKFPTGLWSVTATKAYIAGKTNLPDQGLYLVIGSNTSVKGIPYIDGFRMSRIETQSIDKKLDDGAANTGVVRGPIAGLNPDSGCNDSVANGPYGITTAPDTNDCALYFVLDKE